MTQLHPAQQHLIAQLEQRVASIPSSTDHLMLTKWRMLSAAQNLLGSTHADIAAASQTAIETFLSYGPGNSTDKALSEFDKAITAIEGRPPSVLPFISGQKKLEVSYALKVLDALGPDILKGALDVLPRVRQRLAQSERLASLLPGIKHRFELIAAIVEDPFTKEDDRVKAAAAALYLHQRDDEIANATGLIGLISDDYALRLVFDELGFSKQGAELHWSEKVCSLWYDMPFLAGQNVHHRTHALAISWLDRLNSYVSYTHAFQSKLPLLILLQPAISCSPVHTLVSLLGIVVLDAITSSSNRVQALRAGQTYEVDGKYCVRFGGLSDAPTTPGWLRLHVRDGLIYQPPNLVDRMVPVPDRRLSSGQEFGARNRASGPDPLQRFFNWSSPIGPALIGTHMVLVASRERAHKMFDGIQSNGVELLGHGFVRFLETAPTEIETYGTLIFVVPNLSVVRILLQNGIRVQVVFIDGYDKLERGRHDLPFLQNGGKPPSVICWATSGYFPRSDPSWLPPHLSLELGGRDLSDIIQIENDEAGKLALCQTFNSSILRTHVTPATEEECRLEEAIRTYEDQINSSQYLPELLQYQLRAEASTLRALTLATPALWEDIRVYVSKWCLRVDASLGTLRSHALAELAELRAAQKRVSALIERLPHGPNSRAAALLRLTEEMDGEGQVLHFVCEDRIQLPFVASVVQPSQRIEIRPTLLKLLPVSRNCIVAGWAGNGFGRKLWAHAPRAIHALVDNDDHERWRNLAEGQRRSSRQSVIEFAKGVIAKPSQADVDVVAPLGPKTINEEGSRWQEVASTPCVFLWLVGESQAKIVPRDARLFVQQGEQIREREAVRLRLNDRVILGAGSGRWSPTDEFTEVLIEAVEASHPEVVKVAKEWRTAIYKFREARGLTTVQLRSAFETAGIARELQTLEGWLELSRASPIAPRGAKTLQLLAPLIQSHSEYNFKSIAEACTRLRRLRLTSGRALLQAWKGTPANEEIGEEWIGDLLDRLRREVQVYEVEALTLGDVPTSVLGWWLPAEMISQFEALQVEMS